MSIHDLEKIGFRRIAPSPALRPYIWWFWAIQSNGRVPEQHHEFMHSRGSLSLLFNWGDELEMSDGRYLPPSVTLESIRPYSRKIVLTGDIRTFGILFRPGGAFPFFGMPMHEVTTVDRLHAFNLLRLHDRLSEIPSLQDKIACVELWLTGLLPTGPPCSATIPVSLKLIGNSYGRQSIKQVADKVFLSERQLQRLFKKEVGLSPKKYASIIRLHQARTALKQAGTATLAEVAYLAGYYDQAHFNREFKKCIGITPGAYLVNKGLGPKH